jgi:hypothetical protein
MKFSPCPAKAHMLKACSQCSSAQKSGFWEVIDHEYSGLSNGLIHWWSHNWMVLLGGDGNQKTGSTWIKYVTGNMPLSRPFLSPYSAFHHEVLVRSWSACLYLQSGWNYMVCATMTVLTQFSKVYSFLCLWTHVRPKHVPFGDCVFCLRLNCCTK